MSKNELKALDICREEIEKLGLPMKLIDAKYVAKDRTIIFRFAADNRVDFRELVQNVKSRLHVKAELRQLGPRDNAMQIGGIPHCGKEELCCKQFGRYPRITDEMLDAQGIKSSPKIFGYCGKVKCCYAYEVFDDGTLTENRPFSCDKCSCDAPCEEHIARQKEEVLTRTKISDAPKRYIYLIRHPQTTTLRDDPTVYADGQTDAELSELGVEQSSRILEYLKKQNISHIFSSPLKRALCLAQFLKDQLGIPLTENDDLREIQLGIWSGLREAEIKQQHPKLWDAWIKKPELTKIPQGEQLTAVQQRAIKAITHEIRSAHGNIAFVAHKVTIATYLLYIAGAKLSSIWKYLEDNPISLGQVIKIELPSYNIVERIETSESYEG